VRAPDVRRLLLPDVAAGDEIPALACDVTATTVILGALATRDWRPMHHDRDFAQQRNGVRDIFLNTPNQAAWFERYVEDWTGPSGRLGRMKFRMRESVFPGDRMVLRGTVEKAGTDEQGCGWVELALRLSVGEKTMTECTARVAVPTSENDNPWLRKGDHWKP
jgi:acyl dehydratase